MDNIKRNLLRRLKKQKIMYETFEEWFDNFVEEVRNLEYHGPIMEDAFVSDYEGEKCPYEAAREFYNHKNEMYTFLKPNSHFFCNYTT